MTIIKNAIVYKVTLPTAEQLSQHLEDEPGFLHTPITDADFRSDGFVPNAATGDVVTHFEGGYLLTLRSDEKIIPNGSVGELTAERIEEYHEKHGECPAEEVEREIRAQAAADLCKRAFSHHYTTTALYHQASGLLFVNATSPGKADRLLGFLVRLAGSVESTTIHVSGIKHGLTTRLRELISQEGPETPFGSMQVDDQVKLKRQQLKGEPLEKITYSGTDLSTNHELLDQLRVGFEVEELGMWHPAGIEFRLNHQFRLKGIDTQDVEPSDDVTDGAHLHRLQATQDALSLVAVVQELCDLLGYEAPEPEEEQPAETE